SLAPGAPSGAAPSPVGTAPASRTQPAGGGGGCSRQPTATSALVTTAACSTLRASTTESLVRRQEVYRRHPVDAAAVVVGEEHAAVGREHDVRGTLEDEPVGPEAGQELLPLLHGSVGHGIRRR